MSGIRGQRVGGANAKSPDLHRLRKTFKPYRHGHVTAALPVVSKATTATAPARPPADLSASSRLLWKKLTTDYELDSVAQLELLVTALRSRDMADAARRTLNAEGLTTKDKYGRPKAHPAATILRDQQAAYVNVLRVLGFPGAD